MHLLSVANYYLELDNLLKAMSVIFHFISRKHNFRHDCFFNQNNFFLHKVVFIFYIMLLKVKVNGFCFWKGIVERVNTNCISLFGYEYAPCP